MKKTVFLILSAMVILFSGCAGSNQRLFRTEGSGKAQINTNLPAPLKAEADREFCLRISTQSSLSIDVECIFDYVQGEPPWALEHQWRDNMDPWISLNFSF